MVAVTTWQEVINLVTSTDIYSLREFGVLRQVTLDRTARAFVAADEQIQQALVTVWELGTPSQTRAFLEEYTDRCIVSAVYGAMFLEPNGGKLTDRAVDVANYYSLSRFDLASDPKIRPRELPFLAGPREKLQEALDVVRSSLRNA